MIDINNNHSNNDNTFVYLLGFFGSIFLKLLQMDFFITIILAFACGFVSIIGKHAGTYLWETFKAKFLTKKSKEC